MHACKIGDGPKGESRLDLFKVGRPRSQVVTEATEGEVICTGRKKRWDGGSKLGYDQSVGWQQVNGARIR